MNKEDKDLVKYLVDIHITYGLGYTQVYADGQPQFRIDPYVFARKTVKGCLFDVNG